MRLTIFDLKWIQQLRPPETMPSWAGALAALIVAMVHYTHPPDPAKMGSGKYRVQPNIQLVLSYIS